MRKNRLLILLLLFTSIPNSIRAQWSLGAYGGATMCYPHMNHYYGINYFETVENVFFNGGLSVQYNFVNWFALQTGVNIHGRQLRQWSPNANQEITTLHYLATTRNTRLLDVPIEGCFILPIQRWSFSFGIGPYLGCHLMKEIPMNQKSRFEMGIVGSADVKYRLSQKISLTANCMCFQSLNDNHQTGSKYFKQPIYYTDPSVNVGISYLINKK